MLRDKNIAFLTAANGARLQQVVACPDSSLPHTEPTASGHYTYQRAGKYRHSKYDPLKEAQRLVAGVASHSPALFVVFGCGLGYPLVAMQRHAPSGTVVGIAEPGALAAGLNHVDYTDLPRAPYIWTGAIDYPFKRLLVSLLPPNLRVEYVNTHVVTDREVALVKRMVDEAVAERAQDMLTRMAMEPAWAANIAANTGHFIRSPGIDVLFDQYRDVPAVLVGAGPSLQLGLSALAAVRGRVLLVATDTALKTLLAAKIEPDLVVSVDANPANLLDFSGVDTTGLTLVFEVSAYPEIISRFAGQRIATYTGHHCPRPDGSEILEINPLVEILLHHTGPRSHVQSGGSVSCFAFDLARQMGCSPIVLLGQDLAYSGGMTHAAGSYDISAWTEDMARFTTLEGSSLQRQLLRKCFAVPALDGGTVKTDQVFNNYRIWFEDAARLLATPCFNAGRVGARIDGFAPITLAEVAGRWGRDVGRPSVPPPDTRAAPALMGELTKRVEQLCELREIALARSAACADDAAPAGIARLQREWETLRPALPSFLQRGVASAVAAAEARGYAPLPALRLLFATLADQCTFYRDILTTMNRQLADGDA